MNVNGIISTTNVAATEATYAATSKSASVTKEFGNNILNASIEENAAVYEASSKTEKKAYVKDTDTIAKMKAEAEEKTAQFRELVQKLISQQASTSEIADAIWQKFANGEFTATEDIINQAKEDISEDGYWGVEQTSQRIFDFAKALSGGDPEKMDEMLEAFKKGYDQATKAWGKELPDISSKTYDAVEKKFADYKKEVTGVDEATDFEE